MTHKFLKYSVLVMANVLAASAAVAAPPSGASDVVGRDLYVPGLGFLGHLGMFTGSQQIVQATDAPAPIQVVTWSEFLTQGGYWGARYVNFGGLVGPVNQALDQRAFNPQYTTSSSWQAGRYEQRCVSYYPGGLGRCATWQNVIVPARFRCDTLVIFSYVAGAGVDLTPLIIAPRTVYYTVPGERLPVEDRLK